MDMRGLAHFIQDIRKATSNRDDERRRVEEELAKIRSKFKHSDTLTMYDRKKYLCKLMFVLMLGYRVDFGHMEGIHLLSVNEAAEKLIGYLSLTVFLNEGHELVMLTTHVVHLDLLSTVDLRVSLALTAIGNIGNADYVEPMAEGMRQLICAKGGRATDSSGAAGGNEAPKLSSEESVAKAMSVGSGTGTNPQIKKKALLSYLHAWRKNRNCADVTDVVPIAADLILHTNFGVAMAAVTFLQGVVEVREENPLLFAKVPGNLVRLLSKIILEKLTEPEYVYYGVPAPWLQAKALRLLQSFPPFTEEQPQIAAQLHTVVTKMIKATERVVKEAQSLQKQRGTANRSNAMNCALVELVSLVVLHKMGSKLLTELSDVVMLYLMDKKDANMRYLGLQLLSRLSFAADVPGYSFANVFHQAHPNIVVALHDPSDSSLKRQALSLLYTTCDESNAAAVVADLLAYLPATKKDNFRAELVLTIASITERFMSDVIWFVDTLLQVVWHGGDDVSRDVWSRVFHVVLNHSDVQKRAAETAMIQLRNWGTGSTAYLDHSSSSVVVVKLATMLLGEFGYQIGLNVDSSPLDQYQAVVSKLPLVDRETKAMILTTLAKFYNLFDNVSVREQIVKTLEMYTTHIDTELQQRALEYLALIQSTSDETLQAVLEPLPPMEIGSVLRWHDRRANQNRSGVSATTTSNSSNTSTAAGGVPHDDIWAKRQHQRELEQQQEQQAKQNTSRANHNNNGGSQQHVDPSSSAALSPASNSSTVVPTTAAAAAGGATAEAKNVLDALFVFDDQQQAQQHSAESEREAKQNERYYRDCLLSSALTTGGSSALLQKSDRMLYQDSHVTVRCSLEVRKADARLNMTITTTSSSLDEGGATLQQVSARLATTSAALLVQARGTLEVEVLAPSQSMQLQIAARCLAPFEEPPAYRLQYTTVPSLSQPKQVLLQLPIVPLTFMTSSLADSSSTSTPPVEVATELARRAKQSHRETTVQLPIVVVGSSSSSFVEKVQSWARSFLRIEPVVVVAPPQQQQQLIGVSSLCSNPNGELAYFAVVFQLTLLTDSSSSSSSSLQIDVCSANESLQKHVGKCISRLSVVEL